MLKIQAVSKYMEERRILPYYLIYLFVFYLSFNCTNDFIIWGFVQRLEVLFYCSFCLVMLLSIRVELIPQN